MKKKNKRSFVVSLEIPEEMTILEIRDYIRQAIGCWKGCKDPENLIHNLNTRSVTVKTVKDK